jgi:hypothetical protein
MPFQFDTAFPQTDPACVPRFTRSFEHIDWIDGESIVQAETTPTEEGFNSRFRKIIADLEALGDDARRGLQCAAAIRSSLFAIINEAEAELSRLGQPVEVWRSPTLLNGWGPRSLDTDFDYNPPGYFQDKFGMVHLRGTLGGGPIPSSANGFSSVICTLPVGYRPANRTVVYVLTSGDVIRRLDIVENGQVNLRGAYTTWISLDGLSFGPVPVAISPDFEIDPPGPILDSPILDRPGLRPR